MCAVFIGESYGTHFCHCNGTGRGRRLHHPRERGRRFLARPKYVFPSGGVRALPHVPGQDRLRHVLRFRHVRLFPRASFLHGGGRRRIPLPRRHRDPARRLPPHAGARRPSCGSGGVHPPCLSQRQTLALCGRRPRRDDRRPLGSAGKGGLSSVWRKTDERGKAPSKYLKGMPCPRRCRRRLPRRGPFLRLGRGDRSAPLRDRNRAFGTSEAVPRGKTHPRRGQRRPLRQAQCGQEFASQCAFGLRPRHRLLGGGHNARRRGRHARTARRFVPSHRYGGA